MTRYIDADALKREWIFTGDNSKGYRDAIDEAPTVDAVEVVRCKDCKFAAITGGVYGREPEVKYCDIWFPENAEYMPISYYCASAERKDNV